MLSLVFNGKRSLCYLLVLASFGHCHALEKLMRSDPGMNIAPTGGEISHVPARERMVQAAAFEEHVEKEVDEDSAAGSVGFSSRMLLPDGQKVLYEFKQSERKLCDSGSSSYSLFKTSHDEGCGSDSGRMHVLSNVRLGFSNSSNRVRFQLDCKFVSDAVEGYNRLAAPETQGASFEILHEASGQASGNNKTVSSCQPVQEDTILIMKPRGEDFTNVFHNMEAVFGLLQTADVLERSLSEFRILIAYGNIASSSSNDSLDLVQLDGQLQTAAPYRMPTPKIFPPMLEFWSGLVQREEGQRLQSLPPSISAADGLCFKGRVVLPIHACSGEILTRTWSNERRVHRSSPLTLRYIKQILEAFHLDKMLGKIDPQGQHSVLMIVRAPPYAKDRQVRFGDIEELKARLPQECNMSLQAVDFATVSFAEQMRLARNSSIMLGMHGGGLTHLMFLPENGGVVEITEHLPPYGKTSVANIYYNLAAWTRKIYWPVKALDQTPYLAFRFPAVFQAIHKIVQKWRA